MDRDPFAWAVYRHVVDPTLDELDQTRDVTRDMTRDVARDLTRDRTHDFARELARNLARVAALQSHLGRRHRGVSSPSVLVGRHGRAAPRAVRG